MWCYAITCKVFTFSFTTSKCFCDLAVRKHWTKEFRFVVTRAKIMLYCDNFKGSHYLSFFCCFIFCKRENGCLFRTAAWSVSVCPRLFFLELHLKMILSRLCTLLSKCQHLFEANVYIDHQLTIYLGKRFYTLFLTCESNQQNIMAKAP